jgi:hypothetical protein
MQDKIETIYPTIDAEYLRKVWVARYGQEEADKFFADVDKLNKAVEDKKIVITNIIDQMVNQLDDVRSAAENHYQEVDDYLQKTDDDEVRDAWNSLMEDLGDQGYQF